MTESAQCAKAIRKELKEKFPAVKFSVTSDNFAGGDAVSIHYVDTLDIEKVETITDKYQVGTFDGMTDYYDIDNARDDIPQVKYVMVSSTLPATDEVLRAFKEACKQYGASPNDFNVFIGESSYIGDESTFSFRARGNDALDCGIHRRLEEILRRSTGDISDMSYREYSEGIQHKIDY